MEISHRLQADFTEVEVALSTSCAKPQAVNGRLDSTLSISKTTNQSESVTLKGRPDCLIMGKWVKPPASQHHCCGVPFCGGRYPLTVPLMANPLH